MNAELNIDQVAAAVLAGGPTRVLINADGYAVDAKRAMEKRVQVVVVFIRNDGWTLGAPEVLADYAYILWEQAWVARLDKIGKEWRLTSL